MTRKRKPTTDDISTVELEDDDIKAPGIIARSVTALYWYVHWLYHTESRGKYVIWSKLTRKHYNKKACDSSNSNTHPPL
eukprot:scaffold164710_cov98-Attheya_sp.AAC.1